MNVMRFIFSEMGAWLISVVLHMSRHKSHGIGHMNFGLIIPTFVISLSDYKKKPQKNPNITTCHFRQLIACVNVNQRIDAFITTHTQNCDIDPNFTSDS